MKILRTTPTEAFVVTWYTLGEMRQYHLERFGVIIALNARRYPVIRIYSVLVGTRHLREVRRSFGVVGLALT